MNWNWNHRLSRSILSYRLPGHGFPSLSGMSDSKRLACRNHHPFHEKIQMIPNTATHDNACEDDHPSSGDEKLRIHESILSEGQPHTELNNSSVNSIGSSRMTSPRSQPSSPFQYSIIKPLGKGASGNVVLAVMNQKEVAIKQIMCRNERDLNVAMKVCAF